MLLAVRAAESAIAAPRAAIRCRVARHRRRRLAERRSAFEDHGVVAVVAVRGERGQVEFRAERVVVRREFLAEFGEAGFAAPFRGDGIGQTQRGRPIDRRAAAQRRTGQDDHADVLARGEAAFEVEFAQRDLALRVTRCIVRGAGLEHHDALSGASELRRGHAAARPAADHDHVGIDDRAVARERERERRLRRGRPVVARARIPEAHPGRIVRTRLAFGVGEKDAQSLERGKTRAQFSQRRVCERKQRAFAHRKRRQHRQREQIQELGELSVPSRRETIDRRSSEGNDALETRVRWGKGFDGGS